MGEMTYQACVHFVLQTPANFDLSIASYTCCESEQLLWRSKSKIPNRKLRLSIQPSYTILPVLYHFSACGRQKAKDGWQPFWGSIAQRSGESVKFKANLVENQSLSANQNSPKEVDRNYIFLVQIAGPGGLSCVGKFSSPDANAVKSSVAWNRRTLRTGVLWLWKRVNEIPKSQCRSREGDLVCKHLSGCWHVHFFFIFNEQVCYM